MANKLYIEPQFGKTPMSLLDNPEISLKAKGLYVFLQYRPNGWEFSVNNLERLLREGRDSVRGALKELEEWGYLEKKRKKDNMGKWLGFDYILNQ